MTMTATKLVAGTAADYFSTTVEEEIGDHGNGMAAYYNASGTPSGRWIGSGLGMINKKAGEIALEEDVSTLYDRLANPENGETLTRAKKENIVKGKVVGGFDLTFTMPKSVNILWASGDENIRRTIMRCHEEAISESLKWFEENEAYARVGAGGAAKVRANGVTAVSFTHWDTRDHDPHLHSHVLVSNFVTRPDGTIGALDGKSLLRNTVDISERHDSLLMDRLTRELGVQWRYRETGGAKAAVYDIDGIDDDLIEHFSQRRAAVTRRKRELTAAARRKGTPLTPAIMRRIDREAWDSTRKAKPKQPLSLHELMTQWQEEMRLMGHEPNDLPARTCGRDYSTIDVERIISSPDVLGDVCRLLDQSIRETAATPGTHGSRFLADVERSGTRITESNIRAAARRLCKGIRADQKGADRLVDALVEQEKNRLVELTPARYTVPSEAVNDPELSVYNRSRAATDFPEEAVYATPELLDAEESFKDLSKKEYMPSHIWDDEILLERDIARQQRGAEHPLAEDQKQAVRALLTDHHAITALVGPAGTGKTTTLKVVADLIGKEQGEGLVLGLAPTSAAAIELGESIGSNADTLAKILDEDANNRIGSRLQLTIERYNATPVTQIGRREQLREQIVELTAQKEKLTIPDNGTVIVDEAGMADTFSIEHLARMCDAKHAKIIMVGDDHQLDTPGGGAGAFSWMVDHDRTVSLISVWRFEDRDEARRSLKLRSGEVNDEGESVAIREYDRAGRIHAGTGEDIENEAVGRLVDDLKSGTDSILIVDDNDTLSELNERVSRIMEGRGLVNGSKRATLSDGSTAAVGDIICTRKNNRGLLTSHGRWVRNNDLWQVEDITPDGIVCHRKGQKEDTITLPGRYVEKYVVGGYVFTPHRAQGKTVDHGYYLVGLDSDVSSAQLYVAMTRGRKTNEAFVKTRAVEDMMTGDVPSLQLKLWRQLNRASYEERGWTEWKADTPCPRTGNWYTAKDLDPTPRQQALGRLDDIAANNQIGRFASQWAENYDRNMHSLTTLSREHDYYSKVLARRQLAKVIGDKGIEQHRNEAEWKQLLGAYAEASAIDRDYAERIVRETIDQGSRKTRVLLRRHITDHAKHSDWIADHYWIIKDTDSLPPDQRAAADLLNQSAGLIAETLDVSLQEASDPSTAPEWVFTLGDIPDQNSTRRGQWEKIVAEASAYRAERGITDQATALGSDGDRNRDGRYERLNRDIDNYLNAQKAAKPHRIDATVDAKGIPAGKARAVRAGRPVIVAVGEATPYQAPKNAVVIASADPAETVVALRRIDREQAANAKIVGADEGQTTRLWESLTPGERASIMVEDDSGLSTSLWTREVENARNTGGVAAMQEVVDGLDGKARWQAINEINRENAEKSWDPVHTVPETVSGPEMEAPEVGGA